MTEETQSMQVLNAFLSKAIHSSSPKVRAGVFEEVLNVLQNITLTDAIVRGLSSVIILVSPHYNGKSRSIVRKLILYIKTECGIYDINFQEIFSTVGLQLLESRRNAVITNATSRISLGLLSWTLLTGQDDWSPKFAELISLLTNGVRVQRLENIVAKKLSKFCSTISAETFKDLVKYLVAKEHNLVIVSYLSGCSKVVEFGESNGDGSSAQFNAAMLEVRDVFLQKCLTSKSVPDLWVLDKISDELGLYFGLPHDQSTDYVTQKFIPTLQKALLRSPETAIPGAGYLLENINSDLTAHGLTIAKMLTVHLHSQSETTRLDAVKASVAFVKKINTFEVMKSVLEWYIGVYNGSEGKLTVAVHKIAILEALKGMRLCGININVKTPQDQIASNLYMNRLSEWLMAQLIKIVETEVHEGTLVECFHLIYLWCEYLSDIVKSAAITTYIPKGLNDTKGQVRGAFYMALASYFNENRASHLEPFVTVFCSTLAKLSMQSSATALQEAIPLASILTVGWIKGFAVPEDTLAIMNNVLNHVSDKNIGQLSSITKVQIIHLATRILGKDSKKATEGLYRAVALALGSDKFDISDAIKSLSLVNALPQVIVALEKANKEEIVSNQACVKILYEIVNTPMENSWVPLAILRIAHQCSTNNLWEYLVNKLITDEDMKAVCNRIWKDVEPYILNYDNSLISSRIVSTFSFYRGESVIKLCIKPLKQLASRSDLTKVSRDDYFIFRTPEGQLYDSSVLDIEEASKNMKRESKVYSYKEQLEEIQLKKELEEKRKNAGKAIQLSPRQKDAMRTQLAKEDGVRKTMKELDLQVKTCAGLIQSVIKGNLQIVGHFLKDFINELIGLMQSYIAAPHAVELFLLLAKLLFKSDKQTAHLVTYITLALTSPKYDYGLEWSGKSLTNALVIVLDRLKEKSADDSSSDDFVNASYTLCFPLLRMAVHEYSRDPNIIAAVVEITLNQAKKGNGYIDFSPEFLPRVHMTRLMYHIMGTCDNRNQQSAYSAILALAMTGAIKTRYKEGLKDENLDSAEFSVHFLALQSHLKSVREAGLQSLLTMLNWCDNSAIEAELLKTIQANLFRMGCDSDSELAQIAQGYLTSTKFEPSVSMFQDLLDCLTHAIEEVRVSGSIAIGQLVKRHPQQCQIIIQKLIATYEDNLAMTPQVVDNFGRVLEEGVDKWEPRSGAGLALKEISPYLDVPTAKALMTWLVTTALADHSQTVHNIILEAAVEVVKIYGKDCLSDFVTVIESFLDNTGVSGQYDNVRQACVVLMGCLARHLDPSDSRVKSIFGTLLDTLSTPSEKVQEAVANCLPSLVPAVAGDAVSILERIVNKLMEADSYGERRGAAYGLAGMIKGLGILSLKQHDIMNIIATGMQDKKNFRHREGALMALELLCEFLGRLFEPYIVHVLPYLLQCLGDSNQYVREATENTARRVMSRLSGHGVKLVLPSLLAALNEDSWRTKCGSVDLLGRMAYCAPRQLSGCLPMIVPKLIEVLGDSHVKVQDSATKALGLIGSVIRNPEIQSVVPVLLEALQDPGKKTSSCLQALLKTEFVHFVDPPSLALIMPVVQRAFQDRSTENRKMAAQIIGNMYSLTDHSDLAPYMDNVMPGLKTSLLDPVPEVRAVAAKALGAMSKGMGEKCYDELLPWLMKTLVSEVNSVDRSGAAQGLAEVIGALGEDKLHRFMPEIIRKADSDDLAPHVRDGYMMMFIYMPSVFENVFVPYIGQIINPILKALADENEFVRETALRAGQRIVTGYADTAITLLLPQLEKGVFDDNWRIRFSSIQLLGDLLYKISGVSGKMSTESANDDDNFGTEQSQRVIIDALGHDRRNRVLAGLYMGRSDVALMVRQAALHVWKVVVANTPKTLREILPTLFSLLLGCLASYSHDKRQVAARTLGDLVRKLGEKILPEIIPILEKGLESERSDERQGVCIGLSEIMASTSRDMVMAFVENLVPTLRKALCDPSPQVRQAAAQTFGSLHQTVGSRALDEICPFLMKKLSDTEDGDYALDGLGQILGIKSKAVMPYLVPQLTAYPANTKAIALVASVAGEALAKHLTKLLTPLITVLSQSLGTPAEEQVRSHCQTVVLSVLDDQGTRILVDELLELKKSTDLDVKRSAVTLLSMFCVHTKADITAYVGQLLRGLILLMVDENEAILLMTADALTAVVKSLGSNERLTYVGDVRQAIRFAQGDLKGKTTLPGLCLSKGINPVLPIFREALLNGSADLKEQAALGMGELISLSNSDALKPSVIHITGPLIRILGDRYGANVKGAVLDTLTLLLSKVGIHLKAFLPQLQTTFLKSASDPHRNVRLKAAAAMSELIPIHGKPDPLFQEIINATKQAEDISVKDTLVFTLRATIVPGGDKMTPATKKLVTTVLFQLLQSVDESTRITAAGCLGAMLKWIPPEELEPIISPLLSDDDSDSTLRQARSTALVVGLKEAINVVYVDRRKEKVHASILSMLSSDKMSIVSNGVRACGHLFKHCILTNTTIPPSLLQPFAKTVNNSCNEVKGLLGMVSEVLGRATYPQVLPKELFKYLIPALVNGTKEKNSMVRASCESALVFVLHLRDGDATLIACMASLESGAREALSDVITKVLRKMANSPEGKVPDIDDTVLT